MNFSNYNRIFQIFFKNNILYIFNTDNNLYLFSVIEKKIIKTLNLEKEIGKFHKIYLFNNYFYFENNDYSLNYKTLNFIKNNKNDNIFLKYKNYSYFINNKFNFIYLGNKENNLELIINNYYDKKQNNIIKYTDQIFKKYDYYKLFFYDELYGLFFFGFYENDYDNYLDHCDVIFFKFSNNFKKNYSNKFCDIFFEYDN
jgi:hypothetical protein